MRQLSVSIPTKTIMELIKINDDLYKRYDQNVQIIQDLVYSLEENQRNIIAQARKDATYKYEVMPMQSTMKENASTFVLTCIVSPAGEIPEGDESFYNKSSMAVITVERNLFVAATESGASDEYLIENINDPSGILQVRIGTHLTEKHVEAMRNGQIPEDLFNILTRGG